MTKSITNLSAEKISELILSIPLVNESNFTHCTLQINTVITNNYNKYYLFS